MKKFGLVLLLIAAMATPALAAPTTFDMGISYAQPYGPYKSAVGGEFTLTPTSPFVPLTGYVSGVTSDLGVKGSFQTFCIEADKPIYGYPATYVGDMADTASRGTGWLYSHFAMGILADYVWSGAGRLDTAYLLQQAIWQLEGYSVFMPNTEFYKAAVQYFGSEANAMGGSSTEFGVFAVNLFYRDTKVQDMLVFVPDGGATLMLLGGALMGLGALRRKFRR